MITASFGLYVTKFATCKLSMSTHELCVHTGPNEFHPIPGTPLARAIVWHALLLLLVVPAELLSPLPPVCLQHHQQRKTFKANEFEPRSQQISTRLQRVLGTDPQPSRKVHEALGAESGPSTRIIQARLQNQWAWKKKLSANSVT